VVAFGFLSKLDVVGELIAPPPLIRKPSNRSHPGRLINLAWVPFLAPHHREPAAGKRVPFGQGQDPVDHSHRCSRPDRALALGQMGAFTGTAKRERR